MPTCPDGHQSASADFCDTCGMRIEGAPAPAAATAMALGDPAGAAASGAATPAQACPQCGTSKTGMFCEVCGYDYAKGTPNAAAAPDPSPQPPPAPAPLQPVPSAQPDEGLPYVGIASTTNVVGTSGGPAPSPGPAAGTGWTAVVTADRDYFESVLAAGGPDAASIEFPAYCPERRFTLTGAEMRIGRRSASRGLEPEIDLTGPPTDPGISHLHAVLMAQPDGTWSVLDPGSSNGTQVNGTDVVTGVPVALHPGDRICLGAWTVLTIGSD